jgi:hypothetical protein
MRCDFLVLCNFHLFLLCFSFSLYFDYNYIRDYCIQPAAERGSSKRNNIHWKKLPESFFRAARERQGGWNTTEQHTECESRTPPDGFFGVGVNFNPFFNNFISLSVKFRFERFIILG